MLNGIHHLVETFVSVIADRNHSSQTGQGIYNCQTRVVNNEDGEYIAVRSPFVIFMTNSIEGAEATIGEEFASSFETANLFPRLNQCLRP